MPVVLAILFIFVALYIVNRLMNHGSAKVVNKLERRGQVGHALQNPVLRSAPATSAAPGERHTDSAGREPDTDVPGPKRVV